MATLRSGHGSLDACRALATRAVGYLRPRVLITLVLVLAGGTLLLGLTWYTPSLSGHVGSSGPDSRQRAVQAYGRLPLSFEPNRGQTDARVKFLARGQG